MIVDLFAGPGGWDEGLRSIGRTDVVGIEIEENACATARAAGHERIHADVRDVDPREFAGVEGLIASPPCQPFSDNGKRRMLDDPRGDLTMIPLRWIRDLRPAWVALEQVRAVLPIWRDYVSELRTMGYTAWAEVIDAVDHGVPQHRQRAVLVAKLARLSNGYAELPDPRRPSERISAGVALGWEDPAAWTINTGLDWKKGQPRESAQKFAGNMPAKTITTRTVGQWRVYPPDGGYRGITEREAAILQTFPADYPWQGRTQLQRATQIGDAVPPVLAARILSELGVAARAVAS